MILRILYDVALLLLPFVLYALYVTWAKRRQNQSPEWRDTPWLILSSVGLLLVIASFIVLGLSEGDPVGAAYRPARIEDGRLLPPQVER